MVDPETKKTLGPNERGELCIRGPQVMMGYINNPAATKEAINEEGWLHTGIRTRSNCSIKIRIIVINSNNANSNNNSNNSNNY